MLWAHIQYEDAGTDQTDGGTERQFQDYLAEHGLNDTPETRQEYAAFRAGFAGTGGGRTSPLERYKEEFKKQAASVYGESLTTHLMRQMMPEFALITGLSFSDQAAGLEALKASGVIFTHLQDAILADTKQRHGEFREYFQRAFALPIMLGQGPTAVGKARATQAALLEQQADYEERYEEAYQRLPAGSRQSNYLIMTNFLASEARSAMDKARPSMSHDDPAFVDTNAVIRANLQAVVREAQVKAVWEQQVTAARNRALAHMGDLLRDADIDADVRAKISSTMDGLYDTDLVRNFQADQAGATPASSADAFIAGMAGQDLRSALGSKYEGAVRMDSAGSVDIVGTVSGVKAQRGQESFTATVEAAVADLPDAVKAKLPAGMDAAALLKAANGDVGQARKAFKEGIRKAEREVKADTQTATFEGMAANDLKTLPPSVAARLQIDGKTPAEYLKETGGNEKLAQDNWNTAVAQAKQEEARYQGYKATFLTDIYNQTGVGPTRVNPLTPQGKAGAYSQSFDQASVPEYLRQVMRAGIPLNEMDAQNLARAHRGFSNIYSQAPSEEARFKTKADQGSAVVSQLWQEAGGDAGRFAQALQEHVAANPMTEALDRSTLPGFKTMAEAAHESSPGAALATGLHRTEKEAATLAPLKVG